MPTMEDNSFTTFNFLAFPCEIIFEILTWILLDEYYGRETITNFSLISHLSYRLILDFLKNKQRYYNRFIRSYLFPVLNIKKKINFALSFPICFYLYDLFDDAILPLLDYIEYYATETYVTLFISRDINCYNVLNERLKSIKGNRKPIRSYCSTTYKLNDNNDNNSNITIFITSEMISCNYSPFRGFMMRSKSVNVIFNITEDGFDVLDDGSCDFDLLINQLYIHIKDNLSYLDDVRVDFDIKRYPYKYSYDTLKSALLSKLMRNNNIGKRIMLDFYYNSSQNKIYYNNVQFE